jgi:hypothetical protein
LRYAGTVLWGTAMYIGDICFASIVLTAAMVGLMALQSGF